MQINIDLDCTLNDLVSVWCRILSEAYGLNVQGEDICDYDICQFFPTLSKEQIYNPLDLESFWAKVKPLPDSQEILQKIHNDKHDVQIVTSTHYNNAKIKFKWINDYFPFIHWKKINIIHEKNKFSGDYLIDDCLDNLIGFKGKKILFSQPWNKKYTTEELGMLNITRVNNWQEVYNIIPKPKPCGKFKTQFDFECLNCSMAKENDNSIICGNDILV